MASVEAAPNPDKFNLPNLGVPIFADAERELPAVPKATTTPTSAESSTSIPSIDADQIARANATGRQPVVFIHGLWLLPNSWNRWAEVFERLGHRTITQRRI